MNSTHPCDRLCQNHCGLCKSSLIRKLSDTNDFHIVIGDSITDLQAAKQADKVFARDFLLQNAKKIIFLIQHLKRFTMFKPN